jgi:NADH-quinone oxidoreductase subunit I
VALGLYTTLRTMFRKPVTVQYPSERMPVAPRFHGPPGLLWDAAVSEPVCTGCQICARECPCECISVTMRDNPKFATGESKRKKIVDWYSIDLGLCSYCDICVEVCPFDALIMTPYYETATYTREGFIANKEMLIELTTRLEPAALEQALISQDINPYKEEEKKPVAARAATPKAADIEPDSGE